MKMTVDCIVYDGKNDSSLIISNKHTYWKGKSITLTYVKGLISILDGSHIYYFNMNKWKLDNDTIVVGCIKKTTKKHYICNGHPLIKLKVPRGTSGHEYKKLIDMLIKYH